MSDSKSFTRDEMLRYDHLAVEMGIPAIVLMENAGRGAVETLLQIGARGPVVIVCGKGNNAGDGFVMARWLHALGRPVAVEMFADPQDLRDCAATAFAPLARLGVRINRADEKTPARLHGSQWIVDALLGTGAHGKVQPPFDQAINWINAANRSVLSIDLPSGLDCDTGRPLSEDSPVVEADHTVTFVARKKGFDNADSLKYTGTVHVVSIGVGELDLSPS